MIRNLPRWAGVALLTAIALAATADLLRELLRALIVPATLGLAGALAAIAYAVIVAVLLVLALRFGDDPRAGRLVFIGGLSLLLGTRLVASAAIEAPLVADWLRYHELAVSVADAGPLFSDRPMGLPILMALLYGSFGYDPSLVEVVNTVAAVIAGAASYLLARRAWNASAGGAALVLYGSFPSQVLMTTVFATEVLHGALLTLAILAATWRMAPFLAAAAAGVLLGLSQYVRATSLVLVPALALGLTMLRERRKLALVTLFLLCYVAALGPVIAWSAQERGVLSLSTSRFEAWSLLVGTNQQHGGRWNTDDLALVGGVAGTDEAERIAMDVAIGRILDDPVGVALLAVRKFPVTWGDEHYGARWALFTDPDHDRQTVATLVLTSQMTWALTAGLAVVALASGLNERSSPLLVATLGAIAALVAAHSLLEANPRYSAPLIPLFCALAGGGLTYLARARLWVRGGE